MQPTPNQPILFEREGAIPDCCPDTYYQAKYFITDPIRFQFLLGPCFNAEEQLENPTFENGTGWTAWNGASVGSGIATLPNDNSVIFTTLPTLDYDLYDLEIVVSEGALSAGGSKIIIEGFESQEFGSNPIEFASAPGTYTFRVTPFSNVMWIRHSFTITEGVDQAVVLSYVSLKGVGVPVASAVDMDGNEIDTIVGTSDGVAINWEYVPSGDAFEAGKIRLKVSRQCGDDTEIWLSESICITEANECDILIGGCGTNNVFLGDFMPLLRIKGELKPAVGYDYSRTLNESATGKHTLVYGRRNRIDQLGVNLVPAHVRDFLYFLPMFNSIGVRVGTRPQHYYFVKDTFDDPAIPEGEKHLSTVSMRFVRKEFLEESMYAYDCFAGVPPTVIGIWAQDEAIQTDENELING